MLRDRSSLGQEIEGGLIENVYQLQVMNMTESPRAFSIGVSGLNGIRIKGPQRVEVAPAGVQSVTVQVRPLRRRQAGAKFHDFLRRRCGG